MTLFSDHDLQAILSDDSALDAEASGLPDEAQADLDAYREVWTALDAAPAPFAPGFADRVARAVEAQPRTARLPWSVFAAPALTVLAAALLLSLRAPLAQVFADAVPVDALPWLALALAVLGIAEGADQLVRWRTRSR